MNFWKKILGGDDGAEKVDYYSEGMALLREGKFHDALTSFRLALRESPGDTVVLQQIAISYTRIGMVEEAIRTYRSVLEKDPGSGGAHYGLAFLLRQKGDDAGAADHLERFLEDPPRGAEAREHIAHARATLAHLRGEVHDEEHHG